MGTETYGESTQMGPLLVLLPPGEISENYMGTGYSYTKCVIHEEVHICDYELKSKCCGSTFLLPMCLLVDGKLELVFTYIKCVKITELKSSCRLFPRRLH